jgi:hypothetical protein
MWRRRFWDAGPIGSVRAEQRNEASGAVWLPTVCGCPRGNGAIAMRVSKMEANATSYVMLM